MVIGNGLLAKAFLDYKSSTEILIFASGVSNSLETNKAAFNREFNLLINTIATYADCKLVYFSTISIDDPSVSERPYIAHKQRLENYIKKNVSSYIICRISNVVGSLDNKHTILNYLVNALKNDSSIDIWSFAERNLIDIDDVKFIIDNILEAGVGNTTVTIATSESVMVPAILAQIEVYLQKKAKANLISKGNSLVIDVSYIMPLLKEIEIIKGKGLTYIANLLKKYY